MAKTARNIEGFAQVMRNLNREITGIKNRSMTGLIHASILVQRSMELNEPFVPVDTRNLQQSWTAHSYYEGQNPAMLIGFTANYALWVHEGQENWNWKRPGSGPKFFERALERERENILRVIQETAKVD